MYDTSGGVARERRGYALGERRRQGSGQVSDERTLVGLTCAPLSRRDTQAAAHRSSLYTVALRVQAVVVSSPSVPVVAKLSRVPDKLYARARARFRRLVPLRPSRAEKGADRVPRRVI